MLLTDEQLDAFRELLNIGIGQAANLLSEMVQSHVKLTVPELNIDYVSELHYNFDSSDEDHSSVKLSFTGSFSGLTEIVFPAQSAKNLVSFLTGEKIDSPNLDSLRAETLNEIANMLLNSVMGVISNLLRTHFKYEIPTYSEDSIKNLLDLDSQGENVVLLGHTHFEIENKQIQGDIILILELIAFNELKSQLNKLLK